MVPTLSMLSSELFSQLREGIESLREAAAAAHWDSCDLASMQALGFGHACFVECLADRVRVGERGRRTRTRRRRLAGSIRTLAATQPGFFEAVSNTLADDHPFAASLASLAEGQADGVTLLGAIDAAGGVPEVRVDAHMAIASMAQGLLGRVHAAFNRPGPPQKPLTEALPAFSELLEARLHDVFAEAGGDRESLREAAFRFSRTVEAELPMLVRSQRQARDRFDAFAADGAGGKAEQLGLVLAEAGLQTRKALAFHAGGYALALESAFGRPGEPGSTLLGRADRMSFGYELEHGKDTPLHRVGDAEEGDFVEVWGRARTVEAQRVGDKLVSRLELESLTNESRVVVAVRFAHLPHAGVVPGAFVRANGRVRHASVENNGGLAVEADVLQLAELAGQSWSLALLRSASAWTRPWRTNANLWWSLGFHEAIGSEQENFGAGELIFTDPQRSS